MKGLLYALVAAVAITGFAHVSHAEKVIIEIEKSELVTQKKIAVNFDGSISIIKPALRYNDDWSPVVVKKFSVAYEGPGSWKAYPDSANSLCSLYGRTKARSYETRPLKSGDAGLVLGKGVVKSLVSNYVDEIGGGSLRLPREFHVVSKIVCE